MQKFVRNLLLVLFIFGVNSATAGAYETFDPDFTKIAKYSSRIKRDISEINNMINSTDFPIEEIEYSLSRLGSLLDILIGKRLNSFEDYSLYVRDLNSYERKNSGLTLVMSYLKLKRKFLNYRMAL